MLFYTSYFIVYEPSQLTNTGSNRKLLFPLQWLIGLERKKNVGRGLNQRPSEFVNDIFDFFFNNINSLFN